MIPRPIARQIARLTRTWREVDYAQRRIFELRTGVEVTDPWERF